MSTESDQTEEQAIDFAQRFENMLTEVLGQPSDGQYTADPQGARKKRSASYLIKTRDPQGISLTVGGSTILRLSYRYQCSCRDSNSYLQVDESAITLRAESDPAPIIHYDYVRDPHSAIPAAHINIHASNDSATKAMLACGSKSQGKNRRKAFLEKGTFPTFSSLHFPVGGGRFRPDSKTSYKWQSTNSASTHSRNGSKPSNRAGPNTAPAKSAPLYANSRTSHTKPSRKTDTSTAAHRHNDPNEKTPKVDSPNTDAKPPRRSQRAAGAIPYIRRLNLIKPHRVGQENEGE